MPEPAHKWDIFLAHAGAERDLAERLYELLRPHVRVFLDTKELQLGDRWDEALRRAQRESFVTVVLVSKQSEQAFYQREEIAAAIDMARKQAHRIVPLFLHAEGREPPDVPYGLRRLHGLHLEDEAQLDDAATRLRDLVAKVREQENSAQPADGHAQRVSLRGVRLPRVRPFTPRSVFLAIAAIAVGAVATVTLWPAAGLAVGDYRCVTDEVELRSCRLEKTPSSLSISFLGPTHGQEGLVDRYAGDLARNGDGFRSTVTNQFAENESMVPQSLSSTLDLVVQNRTELRGTWQFIGQPTRTFTMTRGR